MENLSPAERFYKNHRQSVSKYQQKNPAKNNEKCKRYLQKLKAEYPERYQNILQKKREYYKKVVKPRNEQRKNESLVNVIE